MQKNEIELIKMDYRIEYKNHNSKVRRNIGAKFLDISIGHSFFVLFCFVLYLTLKQGQQERENKNKNKKTQV